MHAGLAALFFLLVSRRKWWAALPLFFLMQVTRESTVLLTFVVVLVTALQRKWRIAAGAIAYTVLGIAVVSHYAGEGKGNIHDANTLVYLVGKVPFSVVTSTGLRAWSNTHAKNDPKAFPNEPLYKMELPRWVPSGSLREIGIYEYDPAITIAHIRMYLTSLGVVPSVVLVVVLMRRWRLVPGDELSEVGLIGFIYGAIAFLLSPALGTALGRYISYAWPLGWIAAPEFIARYFNNSGQLQQRMAVLQAIACWAPVLFMNERGIGHWGLSLASVAVALPCHVITIKLLRRHWTG
jgi:hypothetical protein